MTNCKFFAALLFAVLTVSSAPVGASAQAFSPLDYGASGDCVADDTDELQATIDAANGDPVDLGPYCYRITAALTDSTPMHIIGTGNGQGPNHDAHASDGVSEIRLDSSTAYAFEVTSYYPSTFRNFRIIVPPSAQPQTSGGGIKIDGNVSTGVVSGIFDNLLFEDVYDGIYIIRPDRPRITNNWFGWWKNNAIRLVTTSGKESSGGYIRNNRFRNIGGALENEVGAALYSEIGYTHVVDNNFSGGSIAVDFAIDGNDAGNILLALNNVENQGRIGFRLRTQGNNRASMIRIHNNEFSNVAYASAFDAHIQIVNNTTIPDWISDVDITGNVLRSVLVTNARYIWVMAGKNVRVSANQIENIGTNAPIGISIAGVTTNAGFARPIDVFDNQISGTNIVPYQFNSTTLTTLRDTSNGISFANRPANCADGSVIWVTDGKPGAYNATMAGGGSGALAKRQGGNWVNG